MITILYCQGMKDDRGALDLTKQIDTLKENVISKLTKQKNNESDSDTISTIDQVLNKLRQSSSLYPNKNSDYGYGNINASLAVQ